MTKHEGAPPLSRCLRQGGEVDFLCSKSKSTSPPCLAKNARQGRGTLVSIFARHALLLLLSLCASIAVSQVSKPAKAPQISARLCRTPMPRWAKSNACPATGAARTKLTDTAIFSPSGDTPRKNHAEDRESFSATLSRRWSGRADLFRDRSQPERPTSLYHRLGEQ